MSKLALFLVEHDHVELFRTHFSSSPRAVDCRAVRGKTPGAYLGHGTFQWSPAVRGLVNLFLQYAASVSAPTGQPVMLIGGRGSLASSLDYALEKMPNWLFDMFGTEAGGRGIARRLFLRSNPGQKQPGPVAVAINHRVIAPLDVAIFLNDIELKDCSRIFRLSSGILGTDARAQREKAAA